MYEDTTRHGIEYGSARWGTAADIAPYMDKDFFQNIPMTQTERITMASRPKQPKYARNKNILVIGGSGSGKTRFFCKPSLLQAHSSYVCTDPKGTLLPEIGTFLERKKYRIKCLNLINFRKSMKYNPLSYIRSEKDILKLLLVFLSILFHSHLLLRAKARHSMYLQTTAGPYLNCEVWNHGYL